MSEDSITAPVVLFVVLGLLIGGIMREVNKKTKFPYTPLLLLAGLALGHFEWALGSLGKGTVIMGEINPHTILLVFIPVLIFESSFNCDWHIFRRSLVNILLLAGPGVLWGAILIGASFRLILGYTEEDLTWFEAFTLGSVLSATDPVAVVALLKELGASVRFNTLIEGESLLNDGTAMVFYYLFADLAKGKQATPLGVCVSFVQIALGGPLVGLGGGIICAWLMRRIIRDHVLTTSVSVVGCYLTYYLAEQVFFVSGILALVVMGLYLSAVGRTSIYPESEHALHTIWSYIQYACETLIFLLTGVIIGVKLIENSTIGFGDWVRMLLFWLILNVARFIMVLTFTPFLFRLGYTISGKELTVLVYGGLRGALGLCLGLLASIDPDLSPRFKDLTIFYISCMATLTLLVNGTTSGPLVGCLKMIESPLVREKLLHKALRQVNHQLNHRIQVLKSEPSLQLADWARIMQVAGVTEEKHRQAENDAETAHTRVSIMVGGSELDQQLRYKILRQCKSIVVERYEHGRCLDSTVKIFCEVCDVMMDKPAENFKFWELIRANTTKPASVKQLQEVVGTALLFNEIYAGYDLSVTFLQICEEVREIIHELKLASDVTRNVLEELDGDCSMADAYLSELEVVFPETIRSIHTRMAARQICYERKILLEESLANGIMDDSQYKSQRALLDDSLIAIESANLPLDHISFHSLVLNCPLFSGLTLDDIRTLLPATNERSFQAGHKLVETRNDPACLFYVISGSIREENEREDGSNYTKLLGPGSLSPLLSCIVVGKIRTALTCQTACTLTEIKLDQIHRLMRSNKTFEERIYKSALAIAINIVPCSLTSIRESKLRQIANSSCLCKCEVGKEIYCKSGGFLFEGVLTCRMQEGQLQLKGMCELPSKQLVLLAKERAVYLQYKGVDMVRFRATTSMVVRMD